MNYQRTHLDLFSGIGGFAIAAQNCGYTTIGFCEKEPYAQQILKERFGAVLADPEHNGLATSTGGNRRSEQDAGREKESSGTKQPSGSYRKPQLHPDVFTLNGADYAGVDLLTGGFPCQPFSVAGKRLGKADDRAIWPEMLRVIQEARPTWIIGENVAGIVTMELDNILSDLESLGYSAWPLVIPACAVEARHSRDRVWIVAHAGHLCGRGRAEPAEQERAEASNGGEKLANPQRERLERHDCEKLNQCNPERSTNDPWAGGSYVANTDSQRGCLRESRGQDAGDAGESSCTWKDEREWFAESGMGRVAHGIPHRAHRLRGLGNSICPPVAEEIIREIASLR